MIFILKCCTIVNTLLFVSYINNVHSVPQDYCFGVLDRRDCGLPPTPVFSYSKPGSRCEIDTWRGCPSENLFQTEYQCSDLCIGKLFRPTGEGQLGEPPKESEEMGNFVKTTTEEEVDTIVETNLCDQVLNTDNCTGEKTKVYTFDNNATRTCVEADYYGCETENKFDDKEQCEKSCLNKKDKWANSINNLEDNDLENIKNMVDNVADQSTENDDKLKMIKKEEPKIPVTASPDPEKLSASVEEAMVIRLGQKD